MRAEGFFCNLDVLYGGLGIGKLLFWIQEMYFFPAVNFFQFFGHQNPRIRIGIHLKMLDPDPNPYQINTDPQPCSMIQLTDDGGWEGAGVERNHATTRKLGPP